MQSIFIYIYIYVCKYIYYIYMQYIHFPGQWTASKSNFENQHVWVFFFLGERADGTRANPATENERILRRKTSESCDGKTSQILFFQNRGEKINWKNGVLFHVKLICFLKFVLFLNVFFGNRIKSPSTKIPPERIPPKKSL